MSFWNKKIFRNMTFASSLRRKEWRSVKIFNLKRDLFIDSTIQQQKFNLGDGRRMNWTTENRRIEVEVEYTTKAKSNWFFNIFIEKSFPSLLDCESEVLQSSKCLPIFKLSFLSSSFRTTSIHVTCQRSGGFESYFFWNVMHTTTTNVNSLTSWQTINNLKD